MRYFTTLPKGVASHTALVQDIPGIPFGTQVQRAESVAPGFIANKARQTSGGAQSVNASSICLHFHEQNKHTMRPCHGQRQHNA